VSFYWHSLSECSSVECHSAKCHGVICIKNLGPYSQHFIFSVTNEWAQYYTCLEKLASEKHSSLLGQLVSYRKNEVFWRIKFPLKMYKNNSQWDWLQYFNNYWLHNCVSLSSKPLVSHLFSLDSYTSFKIGEFLSHIFVLFFVNRQN
jgi:hypothetical protein